MELTFHPQPVWQPVKIYVLRTWLFQTWQKFHLKWLYIEAIMNEIPIKLLILWRFSSSIIIICIVLGTLEKSFIKKSELQKGVSLFPMWHFLQIFQIFGHKMLKDLFFRFCIFIYVKCRVNTLIQIWAKGKRKLILTFRKKPLSPLMEIFQINPTWIFWPRPPLSP